MATIDNYIGAVEFASRTGDIEMLEEAKTSLREFVRDLLEKERLKLMSRHIKVATNGEIIDEDRVQDNSAVLNPDSSSQINNPSHYQSYIKDGIDCITAMQHAFGIEATAIFCKLNAMKYLWRASSKGGNESIKKAIWYLNKYLELGGEDVTE